MTGEQVDRLRQSTTSTDAQRTHPMAGATAHRARLAEAIHEVTAMSSYVLVGSSH